MHVGSGQGHREHSRLEGSGTRSANTWAGLARHGKPIQYAHVPQPSMGLPIWPDRTSPCGRARSRSASRAARGQPGALGLAVENSRAFSQKASLTTDNRLNNLVSMTRLSKSSKGPTSKRAQPRAGGPRAGHWLLQDAKARFSELVRKVHSDGPQHVTVHGRDEVVVVTAESYRRLKGSATGQALIDAMQASPHKDMKLQPTRASMPVRDVTL
jgi:prevent-host-death family protein